MIEYSQLGELYALTKAKAKPSARNPKSSGQDSQDKTTLFISYPHGEQAMQFARWLKENLEDSGFSVFFDEEGIAKDVDSQSATGNAIKACDGLVAIINPVFVESPFCNNEVAMAQGNGLQQSLTLHAKFV